MSARARAANDIDVTVSLRAPLLYRDGEGTVRHASLAQRRGPAVTLSGIAPGLMRPFPEGAPAALKPYRIHEGRSWLPIPASGKAFRAWEGLNETVPALVGRVVSALSGAQEWVGIAAFGRSPLSVRRGDGQLGLPKPEDRESLHRDESLVPRAVAWAEARFRDDVVHDGEAVYVATPLPVLVAAERFGRSMAPKFLTPPEIGPLHGPAIRLDLREPYLAIATRHCPVTRIEALSALAEAVSYHVDRAGLSLDDTDLKEFVADLPCTALEWGGIALSRRGGRRLREAIQPRMDRLVTLAALGACGLLDTSEEAEALDAGLDLVGAVYGLTPKLLGWRHLAYVRGYAEEQARPRLLGRIPVPDPDAEALGGLSPR